MVIAIIALVMSTTGSAVAAVNFARNAGAVDKKSAVGASASTSRAAGKLVATARGGANKGKIPWKFLADVSNADSFAVPFQVQDNAAGASTTLDATSFGRFEASCRDQNNRAGVEDPSTVITFASTSTLPMNVARRVGNGDGTVKLLQPGTVDTFTINASNTFEYHLQRSESHVLIQGAVRQDRPNNATGACLVWGSVQVIKDRGA
jgi:hypothetical protein